MELVDLIERKDKKKFINFIYEVYKNNGCYKDSLISVVENFLYQKDSFSKECYIRIVEVIDKNEIAAQCIYIYHKKLDALQIAFFEALENKEECVSMIIEEGKKESKKLGLSKMIIGLNGHVSYGVGFLTDKFNEPISFDSLYTPKYYIDYFEKYKFEKKTLTTYTIKIKNVNFSEKILRRNSSNADYRN